MLLSSLMWQSMGFLELLNHSGEQRKAVFNPTWALLSEEIYVVDGALLTFIIREASSIWDHLALLNVLATLLLLRLWQSLSGSWLQQWWTMANILFSRAKMWLRS